MHSLEPNTPYSYCLNKMSELTETLEELPQVSWEK